MVDRLWHDKNYWIVSLRSWWYCISMCEIKFWWWNPRSGGDGDCEILPARKPCVFE